MRRMLKLSLQKPELAATLLLLLLVLFFQIKSNMIFLTYDNMRGMLGFLPEVGMVAIGVTLLMICGEFDLSVGSVFALMPMTMAVLMVAGWGFWPATAVGAVGLRLHWFSEWLDYDQVRDSLLHHDAGHAVHGALDDSRRLRRISRQGW